MRFLAIKMFGGGKHTLGQAADLAGVYKTIFFEVQSDYSVSLINYPSTKILRKAAQFRDSGKRKNDKL